MYVRGEAWRRRFEAKRRRSFGTRKNILNNGFYEKLPAKLVQERRKQGAISGCYEKYVEERSDDQIIAAIP